MSRHGITSCLDDDTIVALLDGRLGDAARTAVLHPLEPCSDCRLQGLLLDFPVRKNSFHPGSPRPVIFPEIKYI